MTITRYDNRGLRNENKDKEITLSRISNYSLMHNINIKVADSDTLRYYIYSLKTMPDTYEIRGKVAAQSDMWDPLSFPGLYYDINENIEINKVLFLIVMIFPYLLGE